MSREVTIPPSRTLAVATRAGIVVPRVIAAAGDQAARRFLEFFAATIRNKNTRMAYCRAVFQFFAWCDRHRVGGIADIEPLHVAGYIETLGHSMAKPTVKQHLAAIRMLFDWLVTGQVVATKPAHSVRGPKHVVRRGKTTVLTGEISHCKWSPIRDLIHVTHSTSGDGSMTAQKKTTKPTRREAPR